METKFIDREEMYSVGANDCELFLCVLVGDVGMWEKKVLMDEAMKRQFQENPSGLLPWVRRARSEPGN